MSEIQTLVQIADTSDVAEWANLRANLWPSHNIEKHRRDIEEALPHRERFVGFLARLPNREAVGFAEASVRFDYVNGCTTSPVAFLEGIYVTPDQRKKGIARLLFTSVQEWARSVGCSEIASDARLENEGGQAMHRSLGFFETQRVVFFAKRL